MKPILLTRHAIDNVALRGGTEEEVAYTVENSVWEPAKLDRLECRMNFVFNAYWNGRYFETKQIRAVFVEEEDTIAVVTVYVYYFGRRE